MTAVSDADVFLVGSLAVPTDTSEEAMALAGEALGDRLCSLPDGEVGLRAWWVAGLGELTFSRHPDIEVVGDDVEGFAPVPGPFGPMGACRITGDLAALSLEGHLPYADAAIASYETFEALRAEGKVPGDVRFHVAVPTPFAAVAPFFGDAGQWDAAQAAWMRAIRADVERILEVVPAADLLLQWDYCTEVCNVVGAASGRRELNAFMHWNPQLSSDDAFALHTSAEYVSALAEGIPDEVLYGYHVCLGTFPTFPTTPVDDLGWVVRIANALVANTPRRVDFVHLPAMAGSGRDFFAPLAGLDIGGARVFLGVGNRDGAEAIAGRAEAAREFLPDFGISHYCGYGRDDREQMGDLLRDLRRGADLLASGPA